MLHRRMSFHFIFLFFIFLRGAVNYPIGHLFILGFSRRVSPINLIVWLVLLILRLCDHLTGYIPHFCCSLILW